MGWLFFGLRKLLVCGYQKTTTPVVFDAFPSFARLCWPRRASRRGAFRSAFHTPNTAIPSKIYTVYPFVIVMKNSLMLLYIINNDNKQPNIEISSFKFSHKQLVLV
jgi:hypothetical protein